ncbi:MAG: hypothetical protein IJX77_07860 [Ruminococcus sp.]|nr:hypothetical protein [Ruminococcus sp.]
MDIEKKAHDLAIFTLKTLIEEKRYDIDMKSSVPEIVNEVYFEYSRIYDSFIKELENSGG